MSRACLSNSPKSSGFTLVELLVSTALIALVALLLVTMTNSTASTWRYTTGRIEQFRGADTAFEAMTRRLSQATLNTYWDYDSPTKPTKYLRQSDLRFIAGGMTVAGGGAKPLLTNSPVRRPTQGVFFQAPLGYVDDAANFSGLDNLLNTWGYYVEFRDEALARPAFVTQSPRYRYRLMELMQPSNSLSIYQWTSPPIRPTTPYTAKDWFSAALPTSAVAPVATTPPPPPLLVHALADNVIALVVLPKLSKKDETSTVKTLSKNYSYDSTSTNADADINPKSQLPPIVQVTLVAIDETSAARMANGLTPPALDASLDAIFLDSTKFDDDLKTLQKTLTDQRIGYRVFTSNVSIRGAKWSRK